MANADRIRILIVDDYKGFRRAIRRILSLESDFAIVGEAQDGLEAIEMSARLRPDVILMDIKMPKLNGIEATKAIVKTIPAISIIGLSTYEEGEITQHLKDAGATKYINKCAPIDKLLSAIRATKAVF